MKQFTVILAIKGTEKELEFYQRSIKSAIALNPDEILIAMDDPVLEEWLNRVDLEFKLAHFDNFRIITVAKDPRWKFQLAHVVWVCYNEAKYDYIYHFDIDSEVRPIVLTGLEEIGIDDVAVLSFTKRTRLKSIPDLIRFISYRIRIRTASNVFSGNYWVYRPHYYEIISKEASQKIKNGIDTLLTEEIYKQDKYKLVTKREIGVNAFDLQNEEYDWRQFQDGIWYFANFGQLTELINEEHKKRGTNSKFSFLKNYPTLYMLAKSTAYLRFGIWQGFRWATKNPDHKAVQKAKGLGLHEWSYLGGEIVKEIKVFKDGGTGF